MTNELIKYDSRTLEVIRQTVAKGATPEEFELFIQLCKSTGLNPFKREIWFIKTGQGVQMMTGINGFYAIANSHSAFDGIETETIEQGDRLVKAVARVYRKDRSRPTTAEAYYSEFAKNYGNWKTMPRVMLSKCAESMALRKAFPQELNQIYSAEEMPAEYQSEPQVAKQQTVVVKPSQPKPAKKHYYEVSSMEGENLSAAVDYLAAAGAVFNSDYDCYESDKPLKKLVRYELSEADLKARAHLVNSLQADPNADLPPEQPYVEPVYTDEEAA